MKFIQKLVVKLSAVSALLLFPFSAFAGSGTIVFGPADPTAVPTLSSSMLILLSVLLILVAFRVSKQKGSGKFLITLIGASFLMASTGGIKLISDLQASGPIVISNPTSETSFNISTNGFNSYTNTSGVIMEVKSIGAIPSRCTVPSLFISLYQQCTVGLKLAPNESFVPPTNSPSACQIDCRIPAT